MASDNKCKLCGARFDVPGAVGDLDEHMKAFHPGKSKKDKPVDDDITPSEAIDSLRAAVERIGELEGMLAEARTENEQLREQLGAGDGSDAETVSDEDLDKLTKPQLEELAAKEEVDLAAAKTNADRVEAIRKHRAATT